MRGNLEKDRAARVRQQFPIFSCVFAAARLAFNHSLNFRGEKNLPCY